MKKIIFNFLSFKLVSPLTRKAFTLAEVLITLGIIGVVAAITIPTLMQNIQNAQFKTAWKKEYSVLSQASQRYLQDNSTTFLGVTNYANVFKDYLHIVQYCDTHASAQGCWITSGQNHYLDPAYLTGIAGIPNNYTNQDLGSGQGLILADGTLISTRGYASATCNGINGECGWILIDVNGANKPNTVGKDIFGIWVLPNKIAPMGYDGDTGFGFKNSCSDTGYGCSAMYLYGN